MVVGVIVVRAPWRYLALSSAGLVRRGHEDGPVAEAAEEAHAPTPVAREAYIKKLVLKRNL